MMHRHSLTRSSSRVVPALLALAGCYTVPETGRQALILPIIDDVAQGATAFADLKAGQPVAKPVTRAYGCSIKY